MKKDNRPEESIPGMEINKYSSKKPIIPENSEKMQKELEKTKKDLDKFKGFIIKKYPFTQAIGILPPQSIKEFIEEEVGEDVPEEEFKKIQKKVHLYIIIPEDKFKETPKIKKEIISEIERTKQNVWVHIKTPIDVWEACLDSKFELVTAIGMSFPLHDKGILSALRVAEIHKSLVLQKFDKYVVSYVVGGSLVRGNVTPTSDVDSFVIINDTDVKRMPRLELKERLRGMIYQYIAEATALAGVKKDILNVQVYLLTDFWESVKDAHPVMFTFIRDGVPLYDRGTFLPWKALLKMGRLKPSPE
ncbi:MAG TPA: nucleotidyltransferase domain-containing protein, partial [Bacillota bacterium]|nr:nucleotidyltransferase domain-containing protein [Bacillota bacterium]